MKKILILLAAVCLLGSCASTYTTRSAKTVDVPANIMAYPTTAELIVSDTKVEGTYKNTKKVVLDKKSLEREAVANALEKSDADVLVSPKFTYTMKGAKYVAVKVTGYPAKYADFRTVTPAELEELPVVQALDKNL